MDIDMQGEGQEMQMDGTGEESKWEQHKEGNKEMREGQGSGRRI